MKITSTMPSFEGVAAGATATCRLPIGLTYETLLLTYSGITLAQMDEIRIIGNGKTIQRYTSGTRLDSMNKFNGRAAASGIIAIDFIRYGLLTVASREITALGTGARNEGGELTTLSVEIDINAAAVAPSLSLKAIQSAPRPMGLLRWVREFTYTAPAIGEFEISDIPKGHLFNSVQFASSDINSVEIQRDRFAVFKRTKAENSLVQSDGERVPVAGVFSYDPTEAGHGAETLETGSVHDLRFVLDMAAAGSVPVVVESLAPFRA